MTLQRVHRADQLLVGSPHVVPQLVGCGGTPTHLEEPLHTGHVTLPSRIEHALVEQSMNLLTTAYPPVGPKEKRYDRGYQGLRFPSATTLPPPQTFTETALEQPSAGVPHQTGGREQTVGRAVTHVGAQKHRSYDQTQVVPG